MTDDPEFQRAMLIVLGFGTLIAAIGTTALYLIFRRFGGKAHFGFIGALVAFLFACCAVLFLVARE
jgi:hypothetical protein